MSWSCYRRFCDWADECKHRVPDEQMKVSKQISNVWLTITCVCSLIHSVQQHHRCWLLILIVSPHMFYATEDPVFRVKGHVVGFRGPLCFLVFVQKMIRGALLVSDTRSDLLGWPKTFSPMPFVYVLLCQRCVAWISSVWVNAHNRIHYWLLLLWMGILACRNLLHPFVKKNQCHCWIWSSWLLLKKYASHMSLRVLKPSCNQMCKSDWFLMVHNRQLRLVSAFFPPPPACSWRGFWKTTSLITLHL